MFTIKCSAFFIAISDNVTICRISLQDIQIVKLLSASALVCTWVCVRKCIGIRMGGSIKKCSQDDIDFSLNMYFQRHASHFRLSYAQWTIC